MTAITCYECIPEPPVDWCQFTSNVTDCDEKSKTNGAEYDVCAKTSFEIVYEGDNHLMNIMNCAKKVCKNFTRYEGALESIKKTKNHSKKHSKKKNHCKRFRPKLNQKLNTKPSKPRILARLNNTHLNFQNLNRF